MEWNWLKYTLIKEPVLKFFDLSRQIKISADESIHGLCAVLQQNYDDSWTPVAYASRSTTETETRYAQIEKENLALAFTCQKFHDYVYGLRFELETDHKPLLAISKKCLRDMTPTIQCLLMKLQRYEYVMMYTPGRQLSRSVQNSNVPKDTDSERDVTAQVILAMSQIPASDKRLKQIASAYTYSGQKST